MLLTNQSLDSVWLTGQSGFSSSTYGTHKWRDCYICKLFMDRSGVLITHREVWRFESTDKDIPDTVVPQLTYFWDSDWETMMNNWRSIWKKVLPSSGLLVPNPYSHDSYWNSVTNGNGKYYPGQDVVPVLQFQNGYLVVKATNPPSHQPEILWKLLTPGNTLIFEKEGTITVR